MSTFSVQRLELPEVLLITPTIYTDARGTSSTTYNTEEFKALGITATFVQGYASFSKKGVIRGLHYQREPYAQEKLVRCTQGRVLDVVVDVRKESPNYLRHVAVELDAAKGETLYVPSNFAHGFCVISDGATVEYQLSAPFAPQAAAGIRYDDPALAISWPTADPILSAQDSAWPPLHD